MVRGGGRRRRRRSARAHLGELRLALAEQLVEGGEEVLEEVPVLRRVDDLDRVAHLGDERLALLERDVGRHQLERMRLEVAGDQHGSCGVHTREFNCVRREENCARRVRARGWRGHSKRSAEGAQRAIGSMSILDAEARNRDRVHGHTCAARGAVVRRGARTETVAVPRPSRGVEHARTRCRPPRSLCRRRRRRCCPR